MKNTETIEITSITTTFEKPEDILEPIYLNLFSVKAKDVNNNEYQIISKQFSSFRIVNEHSNLPYKFDIVHYEKIQTPELKDHINRVGKILFLR